VNLLPNGILEGLWLNPQRETIIDLQPALSLCLDRNYIDSKLTYSLAEQVNSIFPLEGTSTETNFSPEAAADILDSLGWLDGDNDLQTPRTSQGISSIEDGTPLVLSMIILNDSFYEKESELIQQSLWECGIQVDIRAYDAWDYYSDDGPLLQKDFDLILFSQSISDNFPCDILEQDWTEMVFPALNDLENLPSICEQVQSTSRNGEDKEALEAVLPILPLFYHVDVSVARMDICGFNPTSGTSSDLWNIETIDYGDNCLNH
jgi:ABC-type transport system substrate-binding protein